MTNESTDQVTTEPSIVTTEETSTVEENTETPILSTDEGTIDGGATTEMTPIVVSCMENDSADISCPLGTTINIENATYESTATTCGESVTDVVEGFCQNSPNCTFECTNTVMGGDPCQDEVKKVTIEYNCQS